MVEKQVLDFEEMASRPGLRELRPVINSWKLVSEKVSSGANRIVLPNVYLSIGAGFDVDNIISSMTSYLEKSHLLSFAGPSHYYVFYLDYSSPNNPNFTSFSDLYETIRNDLCKFSHPFGGVLAIDISEWVERKAYQEKKFLQFLAFMSSIDENTLAVYLDQAGDENKSRGAYKALLTKTRLEYHSLRVKNGSELMESFKARLFELGFSIDEDAEKALLPTMDLILATPGNEGVLTSSQLAEDIVYDSYKAKGELKKTICLEAVGDYLPNGKWLKDFEAKKKYYLGLVGE